jgi:bifunctional non-homologous end joining protein LigD
MSTVTVGEHDIEVSHPDKVLFPEAELTKADLVDYHRRVAEHMLPHVRHRAIAMERFPDGIDAAGFLQKRVDEHFPDFVSRAELPTEDGTTVYAVVDNPETLAYLAQQGCITLHVWPSRVDRPDHPDRLVFDLDPEETDLDALADTARACRELLAEVGLAPFVKSSGSSGLHVEAPLDRRADFDEARAFAREAADRLAERDPERVTTAHRKDQRGGRLFVDTYRNAYGQHAVAPYAVRAKPGAPVAAPLDWDEVGGSGFRPRRYTMANLFRRLAQKPDPWAGMDDAAGSLAEAHDRLRRLR